MTKEIQQVLFSKPEPCVKEVESLVSMYITKFYGMESNIKKVEDDNGRTIVKY